VCVGQSIVGKSPSLAPPSEQILLKDGHQVALEVDVDGVGHLQRRRPVKGPTRGVGGTSGRY